MLPYTDDFNSNLEVYSQIYENEYRVAVRYGFYSGGESTNNTNEQILPNTVTVGIDEGGYHFLVQLNTGEWAHKVGTEGSRDIIGYINPDNSNLSCWSGDDVGMGGVTTYYLAIAPEG